MTDAEYERTKDRIWARVKKWKEILPLGLWLIDQDFFDGPLPGIKDEGEFSPALGMADPNWEYLHATIKWSVPKIKDATDEELDKYVVHELVHCLIDRLTAFATNPDVRMNHGDVEQDTTILTTAILWTHTAGWNEAKDSLEPDVYEQMARSVAA